MIELSDILFATLILRHSDTLYSIFVCLTSSPWSSRLFLSHRLSRTTTPKMFFPFCSTWILLVWVDDSKSLSFPQYQISMWYQIIGDIARRLLLHTLLISFVSWHSTPTYVSRVQKSRETIYNTLWTSIAKWKKCDAKSSKFVCFLRVSSFTWLVISVSNIFSYHRYCQSCPPWHPSYVPSTISRN